MNTILLAEDDPEITFLLGLHINEPAYKLHTCNSGPDVIEKASRESFDLYILDITLPGMNGLEVCKTLRQTDTATPIIMLTARSSEADKVLALELGADDYITKPFGVLELQARIKALLRRAGAVKEETPALPETVTFSALHIEKDKRKASLHDRRLDLTAKEFDLLLLLASNPGKAFSRHQLLEEVWGLSFRGYEHTVTAHVNRLRMKIEADLAKPEYILTAWGVGYRFAE